MSKLAAAYCADGFSSLLGTCTWSSGTVYPFSREKVDSKNIEKVDSNNILDTWICLLQVRLQAEVVMSKALLALSWLAGVKKVKIWNLVNLQCPSRNQCTQAKHRKRSAVLLRLQGLLPVYLLHSLACCSVWSWAQMTQAFVHSSGLWLRWMQNFNCLIYLGPQLKQLSYIISKLWLIDSDWWIRTMLCLPKKSCLLVQQAVTTCMLRIDWFPTVMRSHALQLS